MNKRVASTKTESPIVKSMKVHVQLFSLTLGLLLLGCSRDTHQAVLSDLVSNINQQTELLKTVHSSADVARVAPQLARLMDEFEAIDHRAGKLGELREPDAATVAGLQELASSLSRADRANAEQRVRLRMAGGGLSRELDQSIEKIRNQ